jgi:large repetitive protein
MKHFVLAFALCSFGGALTGCGGGGGGGGGGNPTTVQILNKQTSIPAGTQFVFNAQTFHNHKNPQGVTWTLTPATGEGTLSNATNSGSSSSVTYTAPNAGCTNCVTIAAASVENPSSTDSDTFSIAGPTVMISTTSVPGGLVGIPYGSALQAIGGTPPYTWSVSSGSLPAGLTITTNSANVTGQTIIAITGTPTAAGTTQFTVQVTDSATPASSMTQQLSITIGTASTANNAELSGQYAFEINSFGNVAGNRHAEVGSFVADGNGNITTAVVDCNSPNGSAQAVPLSGSLGSYAVGADHRGTLTLNFASTALCGFTSRTIAFALGSLNNTGVATFGRLVEFDYTTAMPDDFGSGVMYLQQSVAFALASIKGPYAFQLIGQNTTPGTRVVESGTVTADGAGNLTAGELDLDSDGTGTNTGFTGTLTTDPANTTTFGRLNLSCTSCSAIGAAGHEAVYIVSANQALILTTDVEFSDGLMSGEMQSQSSTSFANADLKGTAVFYLEDVGNTAGDARATLGLASFDGAGNLTVVSQDKNDSGVNTTKTNQTGLTYSVAANGRVTITGANSPLGGYLLSPTAAFLMETSGGTNAGFVEVQSGGPFSAASVSGNYIFGVAPPAVPASVLASGVATSTGNGTLNITADQSGPLGLALAQALAASGLNIASNGVGTDSAGDAVYMISPTKAVLISTSSVAPDVVIIQQ